MNEDVCEFVPQLPLPVVFEGEEVVLEIVRRIIADAVKEGGDLFVVHGHGGGVGGMEEGGLRGPGRGAVSLRSGRGAVRFSGKCLEVFVSCGVQKKMVSARLG